MRGREERREEERDREKKEERKRDREMEIVDSACHGQKKRIGQVGGHQQGPKTVGTAVFEERETAENGEMEIS